MANLLFKSGFGSGVSMEIENATLANHQYITGTDAVTGFTWPPTLGGSTLNALKLIQDGGNLFNDIRTVTGHTGASTSVMYNEKLANTQSITQDPYQLNNMEYNPGQFYVKYWMMVDDYSWTGTNKFRAIWETKTYAYEDTLTSGFRMAAYMNLDSSGNEIWEFRGDQAPGIGNVLWSYSRSDIPFPKNEWFKLEILVDVKLTGAGTGHVFMKVNDQVIGEGYEVTGHSSEFMQVMMLTQLYGSNGAMHQYIDDLEIWDDIPVTEASPNLKARNITIGGSRKKIYLNGNIIN